MEKINILEWETEIRKAVIEKGEHEESVGIHRFWLGNLNGVCNIDGHTDVLSVLASHRVDGTESVVVQVNTPDDDSTIFADLEELPYKVVKEILKQVKA